MRILINVPDLKKPGGVATLFNILKLEHYLPNTSLFILNNDQAFILRIPLKYIEFIFKIIKVDILHINPSLDRKSFFRDALFAWITLLLSKKLIVYWHGWDELYERKIINSIILSWIARHSFYKAHATIVLGTLFEQKLRAMGYKNNIYIETNSAENKFIKLHKHKYLKSGEQIILLFISRLEIDKGVYIAIETLKLLNKQFKNFKLVIAGKGPEEENIKNITYSSNDIEWKGYVIEEEKHKLLTSSHIMFFPSYFPEGLPITVLEAMMYGLPIVTRPVGGIPDIIRNGVNGYMIDNLSPEDNAIKIKEIVYTHGLYQRMSMNNIEKSKMFEPQLVRERIYSYYKNVIGKY